MFPTFNDIPRNGWNSLLSARSTPFLRQEWLQALEASRCATARTGWTPRHLAVFDKGKLVAAAPAWVRDDSDGDFSRDWDLAHAATRGGFPYYPKLTLGVPFTPVTGERILVDASEERAPLVDAIVRAARELCRKEGLGCLQILFPDGGGARELERCGLVLRVSHQFHWRNEGYHTTDDFLSRFSSKRRNMLRRERAAPERQGIALRTARGAELALDPDRWAATVHSLHRSTVDKLMWGRRWLNEDFYRRIFHSMAEDLEVVVAEKHGRVIAGAFNVVGKDRLYGRYWGCLEEHPFLHFNVCYYHSIDECIRRGVQAFEGGAGGEHKIARGFLPSPTWTAHWFADARLDQAFREHLREETPERERALQRWLDESPILKVAS